MRRSALSRWGLLGCALALAGCSANFRSVFRHKPIETDASITSVDAKQRAILSNLDKDGIRRFCSEPSPDVFSVVAQALAFGGSLEKSADPRTVEAALKAAFSSAEQGTTIPRTQTINMLRELMFRTCERYLDGGYNPLELSVQAVRDQRLMISILAIEQLTGAVTPPVVGIGAAGSASSGAGADAIVRLDDALKEQEAAEAAEKSAQSQVDKDKDACDAVGKLVEDKTVLDGDQEKQQATCTQEAAALASAKTRASTASGHYADLKKLAAEGGGSALTAGSAAKVADLARAHSESIDKVAGSVVDIVAKNFNDGSEVMLFCIKALTPETPGKSAEVGKRGKTAGVDAVARHDPHDSQEGIPAVAADSGGSDAARVGAVDHVEKAQSFGLLANSDLRNSCISYLLEKVRLEQESLKAQQEQLKAEQAESASKSQAIATDQFGRIWPAMEKTLKDPAARKRFIEQIKQSQARSDQKKTDCFETATTQEQSRACFMNLGATARNRVEEILTGGK